MSELVEILYLDESRNYAPHEYLGAVKWYGRVPHSLGEDWIYTRIENRPDLSDEATREFLRRAEEGWGDAQLEIAWRYLHGTGVEQDDLEAVRWYLEASERSWDLADHSLGWLYANGRGVEQNDREAVKWYRSTGSADAKVSLGRMYVEGRGVSRDYQEAWKLFLSAALQGLAPAQNDLARLYLLGLGRTPDCREAYFWSWLAAVRGDRRGQAIAGSMLSEGHGVELDLIRAWVFLELASFGEGPAAQQVAATQRGVSRRMTPEQLADARARFRQWRPKTWHEVWGVTPD